MIAARAAAAALGVLTCASPALAVDRTAGANVPKPQAAGAPWSDADVAALRGNLDRAFDAEPALRGAHAGLLAVDARDGRVLYARAADDAFQPASTLKLLTGSVALDVLGTAFRFRTDVFADGTVDGGVLHGRLVLRGGGDPLLSVADLDDAAAAVARAGVRSVTGGIAIDDTHGDAPAPLPGWMVDDVPYAYAALPSAVTVEHNAVHLTVTPGARPGDRARVAAVPLGTVGVPIEGCAPTARVVVLPYARTGAPNATGHDRPRARPRRLRPRRRHDPRRRAARRARRGGPEPARSSRTTRSPPRSRDTASTPCNCARSRARGPTSSGSRRRSARTRARCGRTHPNRCAICWATCWLPSDNLAAELLLREIGAVASGAPGAAAKRHRRRGAAGSTRSASARARTRCPTAAGSPRTIA